MKTPMMIALVIIILLLADISWQLREINKRERPYDKDHPNFEP